MEEKARKVIVLMNSNNNRSITVCYPFVGDSIGGAQISTQLLFSNLPTKFKTIIVVHERGPLTDLFDQKSIEYKIISLPIYVGSKSGILNYIVSFFITVPRIWFFLVNSKIDIVHAQDYRINLSWVLPTKLSGKIHIWHQRSKIANSRLVQLLIRLADLVVFNSKYCANTLPKKYSLNSDVINNPFINYKNIYNKKESKYNICKDLKFDLNTKIVGFIGNLTEQKRPFIFLKAAANILRTSSSPVFFLVIGADRSGFHIKLKDLADELGISGNIKLLGFCYPVEPFIAACDLIIAPEVEDAFGRSLVESMLLGTPVVASDSGGHKEIIENGQTGYLFPEDNIEELTKISSELLEDDDQRKFVAEKAKENAESIYSIDKHIERIAHHYNHLTKKNI